MGRYLRINDEDVCSKYYSKIIVGTLEFVDKFYFKKHTKHLEWLSFNPTRSLA